MPRVLIMALLCVSLCATSSRAEAVRPIPIEVPPPEVPVAEPIPFGPFLILTAILMTLTDDQVSHDTAKAYERGINASRKKIIGDLLDAKRELKQHPLSANDPRLQLMNEWEANCKAGWFYRYWHPTTGSCGWLKAAEEAGGRQIDKVHQLLVELSNPEDREKVDPYLVRGFSYRPTLDAHYERIREESRYLPQSPSILGPHSLRNSDATNAGKSSGQRPDTSNPRKTSDIERFDPDGEGTLVEIIRKHNLVPAFFHPAEIHPEGSDVHIEHDDWMIQIVGQNLSAQTTIHIPPSEVNSALNAIKEENEIVRTHVKPVRFHFLVHPSGRQAILIISTETLAERNPIFLLQENVDDLSTHYNIEDLRRTLVLCRHLEMSRDFERLAIAHSSDRLNEMLGTLPQGQLHILGGGAGDEFSIAHLNLDQDDIHEFSFDRLVKTFRSNSFYQPLDRDVEDLVPTMRALLKSNQLLSRALLDQMNFQEGMPLQDFDPLSTPEHPSYVSIQRFLVQTPPGQMQIAEIRNFRRRILGSPEDSNMILITEFAVGTDSKGVTVRRIDVAYQYARDGKPNFNSQFRWHEFRIPASPNERALYFQPDSN